MDVTILDSKLADNGSVGHSGYHLEAATVHSHIDSALLSAPHTHNSHGIPHKPTLLATFLVQVHND